MGNNNIYMSNVPSSTGCTADHHYNQKKKKSLFPTLYQSLCLDNSRNKFFFDIFHSYFNILTVCVWGKASCSCPFPEATRSCTPQAAGLNCRSSSAHLGTTPQWSRQGNVSQQPTPHSESSQPQHPNPTAFNTHHLPLPAPRPACGNTPHFRHFWVTVKHAKCTFHSLGFFKPD